MQHHQPAQHSKHRDTAAGALAHIPGLECAPKRSICDWAAAGRVTSHRLAVSSLAVSHGRPVGQHVLCAGACYCCKQVSPGRWHLRVSVESALAAHSSSNSSRRPHHQVTSPSINLQAPCNPAACSTISQHSTANTATLQQALWHIYQGLNVHPSAAHVTGQQLPLACASCPFARQS
ncbi:hypothetical protein COO60DRAFT_224999 [Scenedesmus sp. NREL 46B-D3]|nr:hypothetical protein COO60DRAFT_224999 [Scenedesmus sp. NREL 46B-D3]